MRVILIRHGMTKGNKEKRYVGITEEALCDEGKEFILEKIKKEEYPQVQQLFASPRIRCKETARLIYPKMEMTICEAFKECEFGEFEYKNHKELNGNSKYQAWIDSGGTLPFPGGESLEEFRTRCVRQFEQIVNNTNAKSIAIVVHGGTIMAIMSALSKEREGYFDWMTKNGCGYICEYEKELHCLQVVEEINE